MLQLVSCSTSGVDEIDVNWLTEAKREVWACTPLPSSGRSSAAQLHHVSISSLASTASSLMSALPASAVATPQSS
jgi:hypothetical protein